jgi:hypothetical protein
VTSESNRNKNQNPWQELADQLGLSDEPQEASAPAKKEAPAPAPVERHVPETRQKVRYEEPDESFALAPALVEPEQPAARFHRQEVHEEPVATAQEVHSDTFDESGVVQSESAPDAVLGEDSEGQASGDESPSPRTAGRRRRRRRSSGKKKEPMAGAPETPEAPETLEEPATAGTPLEAQAAVTPIEQQAPTPRHESIGDAGNQRGRNRGRGGRRRRDEEPEVVEEPSLEVEEVHESGGLVGLEDESEDEEVVNYSDWSVPSWKDLIASLHRPER